MEAVMDGRCGETMGRGGISFLHRGSALFSAREVKTKLAGGRAGP